MKHIMVDLETMSSSPRAAIVSIGAVEFSNLGLGREFYVNVELQSSLDYGLEIDGATVGWWLRQEPAAQQRLLDPTPQPLHLALDAFHVFLGETGAEFVWSKPADFDLAILHSAYRAKGHACGSIGERPWDRRKGRCMNTFLHTVQVLGVEPTLPPNGLAHDALSDSKYQAQVIVSALQQLVALGKKLAA